MGNRKFVVTLKDVSDEQAVTIGNAIWATVMTVHEAADGAFRFTVDHDGPQELSEKLNTAWQQATDGIRWT